MVVLHGPETTETILQCQTPCLTFQASYSHCLWKRCWCVMMLMVSTTGSCFAFLPRETCFLVILNYPFHLICQPSGMCMKLLEHSTVNTPPTRLLMKVISSSWFAMMLLLLGRAARLMTPYKAFYQKQGGTHSQDSHDHLCTLASGRACHYNQHKGHWFILFWSTFTISISNMVSQGHQFLRSSCIHHPWLLVQTEIDDDGLEGTVCWWSSNNTKWRGQVTTHGDGRQTQYQPIQSCTETHLRTIKWSLSSLQCLWTVRQGCQLQTQ